MVETIFRSVELQTIECCNCHIIFAVPKEFQQKMRETHEFFYCPNGHSQHYTGKSTAEKWKEYSKLIERDLKCCKSDKEELFGEIKQLRNNKKELQKDNRYLKKMKTQYKNKLKQIN